MYKLLSINLLIILSFIAPATYAMAKLDQSELAKMQDFHLHQAEDKLSKNQIAQAWGDFAYLLCHIHNHYIALQRMIELAPQLDKQAELALYFEKALREFPNDQDLLALYQKFLEGDGQRIAPFKK